MIEFMFISPETQRLMRLLYDEEEFWEIIFDMRNSDGWLILPFNDTPVLEHVDAYVVQAYNWRLN